MTKTEKELLRSFVDEVHRRCSSITSAVAMVELGQGPVADLAEQRGEAHALKGTAATLGLSEISQLAARLETALEEVTQAEHLDMAKAGEMQALAAEIEDQARALDSAED
jgi:HPt (histidine-containing phosphotransfer) domain-containing protein